MKRVRLTKDTASESVPNSLLPVFSNKVNLAISKNTLLIIFGFEGPSYSTVGSMGDQHVASIVLNWETAEEMFKTLKEVFKTKKLEDAKAPKSEPK